MEFEYDENKSRANLEKHGIDFEQARRLWDDPERLLIPSKYVDEERYVLIGKIKNTHWSAVFTYRNDKIRIISVRRSRNDEKKLYES